ncbi:MAG TPA: ANTAR domain-containing protein [Nevskiaceae bacterium]|nr:ANTAR domain-containing protein [Nevskiaceae bacterium]
MHRKSKGFRVMLVDDEAERSRMLEEALTAQGHRVVARVDSRADLVPAVEQSQPEIVLIDVDAPARETLDSLGQMHRSRPRPVVLFAARSDAETTRRAVQAGVSAYIVDGLQAKRITAVLEVAIARFEMHQAMRSELDRARSRLSDSRDIEKAKGLLMKRRGIDEETAFALLRRMAMDRQQKLGELARALIAAADVL